MADHKKLPIDQQDTLADLAMWSIKHGRTPAIPSDQTPGNLKSFNALVRRGFAIRYEFTDRRRGYGITNDGLEHLVATEPENFSFKDKQEASHV